jgi:hypothetical protein
MCKNISSFAPDKRKCFNSKKPFACTHIGKEKLQHIIQGIHMLMTYSVQLCVIETKREGRESNLTIDF